ncbi:MAG: hypothetical protein M1505_00245 [Patescibacteria group bacterium]|nr:hypothetical protein [Patescibacteria group bacterium]MCL5257661.1 hypothetical protein [Patescibacteria group bacterium]
MVIRKKSRTRSKPNLNIILGLILAFLLVFSLFWIKFEVSTNLNIHLPNQTLFQLIFFRRSLANQIFKIVPDATRITFSPNWVNFNLETKIETEAPIALICDQKCYYLGNRDYIFEKSSQNQPSNLFPIRTRLTIYPNSNLKANLSQALSKVFNFSQNKKLPLSQAKIMSNGDLQFFFPHLGSTAYFLIDPNVNLDQQLNKLDAFLDYEKNNRFEEIDLRIDNRIYYK